MLASPAFAYDPGGELKDAAQEARARDLFRELRCMVCQNQSIDDSDAPLAKDLRTLVRERVQAGDSNDAIKDFLVARYGNFVLLKPPLAGETLILWGTPVAILLIGGGIALLALRRRRAVESAAPLSADERRKLDELAG
nr:cytochrome c-type biogenesis protein [Terrihabitans soli]